MRKSTRIFLGLSLALLVSNLLFVVINYRADGIALQQVLDDRGARYRSSYELAFQSTLTSMLQMATLISHDQRTQQLFLAGKRAVEAEGGGPGGEEAARIRSQLFKEVGPSWRRMTEAFDARQLHFHLGPGSLSFLRVHRPEKFGDRMDNVRFTIVDSYANQSAITGFEIGRIYSGLRGVVPMYAKDPISGEQIHVGTLEVGTSFSRMFDTIDRQLDVGIAALLKSGRVEKAMWGSFIENQFEFTHLGCECKVEAASRPVKKILDATLEFDKKLSESHTRLIQVDGHYYSATHFALFDYPSLRNKNPDPVGAIMIWSSADDAVAAYQENLRQNLAFAVGGFLLIELLLWYAVRFVTQRLEHEVSNRTEEVHRLNERLGYLAVTDELTGLANRRSLLETLDEEVSRAHRHGFALTLLMFDLDHFKRINDNHGHPIGDEVLRHVGHVVRALKRSSDVAGRYGGEEFCLALPHTDPEGGVVIAERLRKEVSGRQFPTGEDTLLVATVSIGIATLSPEMTVSELIEAADKALYMAKSSGRDCVQIAPANIAGNS